MNHRHGMPQYSPDPVLQRLAERFAKDAHLAAWFAIGVAQEALAQGRPRRAREVLDAFTALAHQPRPVEPVTVPVIPMDRGPEIRTRLMGPECHFPGCTADHADDDSRLHASTENHVPTIDGDDHTVSVCVSATDSLTTGTRDPARRVGLRRGRPGAVARQRAPAG